MCELWAAERRVVVDGRGGEHSNGEETRTQARQTVRIYSLIRLRLCFDQNEDRGITSIDDTTGSEEAETGF
jgi:hypothetical protein